MKRCIKLSEANVGHPKDIYGLLNFGFYQYAGCPLSEDVLYQK